LVPAYIPYTLLYIGSSWKKTRRLKKLKKVGLFVKLWGQKFFNSKKSFTFAAVYIQIGNDKIETKND